MVFFSSGSTQSFLVGTLTAQSLRELLRTQLARITLGFWEFRRVDKPRFQPGITSFFLVSGPDRTRFELGKSRFRGEKRVLSRLNAYRHEFR